MGRYDKEDDLKFVEIPSTALSTTYGRPGVIYEVYDQPGRPQYRWDGSRMVSTLEGVTNPLTGEIDFFVDGQQVDLGGSGGSENAVTVSSWGTPTANAQAIQAAVDTYVSIGISAPAGTVIEIDQTINVPSNRLIYLSDRITLRKVGTTTTQVFSNADKVAGNTNISIIGHATIDGNAANVTGVVANIRNWNAINMVNVDGLVVSGTSRGLLTIRDAYKYILFAGAVRNFRFEDLNLLSEGAANPGRDGIHLAGLSRAGIIQRCYGETNDDFIAINPRAIPLAPNETYAEAMGPIRDVVVRDIYGRVRDRSGNVVALYGANYDDDAQTVFDGDYTASTPTSTRPAITGISASGGVATVTTNKPHRMVEGDMFKITGSNPSAYDTSLGVVQSAPSATTFTYIVSSTAGAYVSGAALTIHWHLDNVTVENVRGNTFQSAVFGLLLTPGANQTGGVIRGLRARGISGAADSAQSVASNTAVVGWTSVALVDCEVEDVSTTEPAWMRLVSAGDAAGKSAVRAVGHVKFSNIRVENAYQVNQTTGQGAIALEDGLYEGLVFEGVTFRWGYGAGGWSHGITMKLNAGSDVTLRNCGIIGTQTGGVIASLRKFDPASTVTLDHCYAHTACDAIIDIKDGAPVTGGAVVLRGGSVPAGTSQVVKCYGNSVNVVFTGGLVSKSTNALVKFLGASVGCTAVIDESVLSDAATPVELLGTGPYNVRGLGAKINVADAKLNRQNGVVLYNTNAAAGTLGAAGLVVGQGTSAGSWKLMADPTKSY